MILCASHQNCCEPDGSTPIEAYCTKGESHLSLVILVWSPFGGAIENTSIGVLHVFTDFMIPPTWPGT